MIVKYLSNGVWGYMDHIRQVASRDFEPLELIKKYDEEVRMGLRGDTATYIEEMRLPDNSAVSNKIFLIASEEMKDLIEGLDAHTVNLVLADKDLSEALPVYAILLYVEDCKEHDVVILITNQKCYLMNDEGKTIERLV